MPYMTKRRKVFCPLVFKDIKDHSDKGPINLHKNNKKMEYLPLIVYAIISIILNRNLFVVTADSYIPFLLYYSSIDLEPVKNYFLNYYPYSETIGRINIIYIYKASALATFLFSFLSPTQLGIFLSLLAQFFAFLGAYLLIRYYIKTYYNHNDLCSSFFGGLIYGLNPSFFVGDYAWVDMKIAYASLPYVVLFYTKFLTQKKIIYGVVTSLILNLNANEHFLWVGFPLLLLLVTIYHIAVMSSNAKKLDVDPLLRFIIVISLFVVLEMPNLIVKFIVTSPQTMALTKAGIDVPWSYGYIFNMLRAASHFHLPQVYESLSLNESLNALTLLIPILSFTSLLIYKRNHIILFYSLLVILSSFAFYVGSPLKSLHYYVVLHTPFGPAFRTWRISDGYIALSLSVLIGFVFYYICRRLSKKSIKIPLIAIYIALMLIYSWPQIVGFVKHSNVPKEYFDAYYFLSSMNNTYRIIYLPELTYKSPFWSNNQDIPNEFLVFFSNLPPILATGLLSKWSHFYDFTVSPYYYSLIKKNYTIALYNFLKFAGVKYIFIHNDILPLQETVNMYIKILNKSNLFKLVYMNSYISIFELNGTVDKIILFPQIALVSGGYRVLGEYYECHQNVLSKPAAIVFLDNEIPLSLFNYTKVIITDKQQNQVIYDILFHLVKKHSYIIYPYNYVTDHDPYKTWSRASYHDPHQQVWHPYVNWRNYAWDFDYGKGVIFTINSNDSIFIPFYITETGQYRLMMRLMNCDSCGRILLNIENQTFYINTKGNYNGFLWYDISVNLSSSNGVIKITNLDGFNAISVLYLISDQFYNSKLNFVLNLINNFTIINLPNCYQDHLEYYLNNSNAFKINYFRIHPYTWKVIVNASSPFVLAFSELYDPNWVALVYLNGILVESTSSFPLFDVINGFLISKTGNLEIIIKYSYESVLNTMTILSLLAHIFILFYLIIYALSKILLYIRNFFL